MGNCIVNYVMPAQAGIHFSVRFLGASLRWYDTAGNIADCYIIVNGGNYNG